MEKVNWFFVACLYSNIFMFGVISFVQLVHYPSFLLIRSEDWTQFHNFHARRTGWVVAVPMALQLFSTIFINSNLLYLFTALALATTVFLSMPLHQKLSRDYNRGNIQKLILSNWIRVLGWGGASFILIQELIAHK